MKIAWASCENLATPGYGWDRIAAHVPDVFIDQGDTPYTNGAATCYGYTSTGAADVSTTQAQYLEKYRQFAAKPSFARLLARRASGMLAYWQPDDHEWPNDNWDHTATTAATSHTTQAQVNSTWKKANDAQTEALALLWDNPVPDAAGNTQRPASATTESQNPPTTDYPIKYFVRDFGTSVRIIFLDCISYRGPRLSDGEFLGTQQEAWLTATLAASSGFDHVFVSSTKKLFQSSPPALDNDDTFGQYPTARNRVLGILRDSGIPVVWLSGDRHTPHVMDSRIANGQTADVLDVCACPIGVDINGVTEVPNMVWVGNRQCYGLVTTDSSGATIELRNAVTGGVMYRCWVARRSNLPVYADVTATRLA